MPFSGIYRRRRVLLTGHTGFKGSCLAFWLRELGAEVLGVALPPEGNPNHWELIHPDIRSVFMDVREAEKLQELFHSFQPEIVFHLAARALVLPGYADPAATFAVNAGGTVNILEACRSTASVRAAVIITSDKCYENREERRPLRESDPPGGRDPYSASKGCAEIITSCYRRSFFPPEKFGRSHQLLLASARAGNVVGGGDWAAGRLVPDLVRAAADNGCALLRAPHSIRPWQHVWEPLSGYLALGEKLLGEESVFADAWNFGPSGRGGVTVEQAAGIMARHWPRISFRAAPVPDAPYEAGALRLDCTKARRLLGWRGIWSPRKAFRITADWYRRYYDEQHISTASDLDDYIAAARKTGVPWTR